MSSVHLNGKPKPKKSKSRQTTHKCSELSRVEEGDITTCVSEILAYGRSFHAVPCCSLGSDVHENHGTFQWLSRQKSIFRYFSQESHFRVENIEGHERYDLATHFWHVSCPNLKFLNKNHAYPALWFRPEYPVCISWHPGPKKSKIFFTRAFGAGDTLYSASSGTHA